MSHKLPNCPTQNFLQIQIFVMHQKFAIFPTVTKKKKHISSLQYSSQFAVCILKVISSEFVLCGSLQVHPINWVVTDSSTTTLLMFYKERL